MASFPKTFVHDGIKWSHVKRLGKGSFGEAHLVETQESRNSSGERVSHCSLAVCKVIHLVALNADERKEAQNEVKVLARLSHPGIVEYYGSFQQDGYLCILMEYADGGDLEQLINRRKGQLLDESFVGSIFAQIAYAVKYLHERRILHRDLKTQNVFLKKCTKSDKLIVKLGDFGISTVLRNTLALAKTVCGTPYYFSPELCLNRPYNNKSDVWSLGCILYELCTLKHAFDAQNMKALSQRILKGNYQPIPKEFGPDASQALNHMLMQKVHQRACIQEVSGSSFVKRHTEAMFLTAGERVPQSIRTSKGSNSKAKRKPTAREQLTSMAEIRARAEISSGDAQEAHVAKARRVALDIHSRQEDRLRRAQERDEQLELLKRQMAEVDEKMRSRREKDRYRKPSTPVLTKAAPPLPQLPSRELARLYKDRVSLDAPWNAGRAVPVGFTKESWEVHQKLMVKAEPPPMQNPLGEVISSADPDDFTPTPEYKLQRIHPDSQYHGAKPLDEAGETHFLKPHLKGTPMLATGVQAQLQTAEAAAAWELERKKIREVLAKEIGLTVQQVAKMTPAEIEWEQHRKKIAEARRAKEEEDRQLLQQFSQSSKPSEIPAGKMVAPRNPPQYDERYSIPPQPTKPQVPFDEVPLPRLREVMATTGVEVYSRPPLPPPVASRQEGPGSASAIPHPQRQLVSRTPTPPPLQQVEEPDYEDDFEEEDNDEQYQSYEREYAEEDEYQAMVDVLRHPSEVADPPELFEESELPGNEVSRLTNMVKFTLDGRTLHLKNVDANDPLPLRVEALRLFLKESLGGERSYDSLRQQLEQIQSPELEDWEADAALQQLQQGYGPKTKFVDLMVQLLLCEDMLDDADQ